MTRPTTVSSTLQRSITTRYTIIISVLSSSGVSVLTSVEAMEAFVPWRCRISPARRWEKNSVGMRRTFHMNSLLPTIAILPLIFRE